MRRLLLPLGYACVLASAVCALSALQAVAISALVGGLLGPLPLPPPTQPATATPGRASAPSVIDPAVVRSAFDSSSARSGAAAHAPGCTGVVARIISESADATWSMATLSREHGRSRLVRVGDRFDDDSVAFIGGAGGSAAPSVWLERGARRCIVGLSAVAASGPKSGAGGGSFRARPRPAEPSTPPPLLAGARIGHTPLGLALHGVRPGSLLAAIGLEEGDVIRRVNGLDARQPEAALLALGRLRNGGDLALDVERKSRALTLTYRVR